MRTHLMAAACCLLTAGVTGLAPLNAQESELAHPAPSRLTQAIDAGNTTTLSGHRLRAFTQQRDLGLVENSLPVSLNLNLKRTPAQQADLDALLAAQQNPNSPMYHKWLTPAQFGARFGATESDLQKISEWLESQGFEVAQPAKNASVISFKATSAGVRQTFGAELHYVNLPGGGKNIATATEPKIPTALAGLVSGIAGLNNIRPHEHHTPFRQTSFDAETHKWKVTDTPSVNGENPQPHYLDANGYDNVSPQDYYTIYNVNPVFASGNVGAAATVAIVGEADFHYGTVSGGAAGGTATGGDVTTFRNLFGIKTPLKLQVQHGDAAFPCTDPTGTDSGETALDSEWSGALAPGATIIVETCSPESGGFLNTIEALVDANVADIISSSLGISEQLQDAGQRATFDTTFAQAAAQGQTVLSAQGDSGSDDTDFGSSGGNVSGLSIDYPGSSPLVLSIGGTDFQDVYDADLGGAPQSTYWGANSQYFGNALSYVPETAWDESCADTLNANDPNFGGGVSPATYCANQPQTHGGGGGGISIYYSQPSWQTGIPGLSSSVKNRATPDVSMFAAGGGVWNHFTVSCDSGDASSACTSASTIGGAGGTSFAAPEFAGILGLVKTATGSRQGLVQPALYALAKAQYASGANCYANGQTSNIGTTTSLPASSCIFHDVTTGDNDSECTSGSTNCFSNPGAAGGLLTSNPNTSILNIAYPAGPQYDIATGLGSVNVANLVTKWNTAFSSTTKLTANPTSISSAQSTTLTATVTTGTPPGYTGTAPSVTGTITFSVSGTTIGACALSGGTCSTSVVGTAFPTATNSVIATFTGGGTYPSSTSNTVVVTVSAPPPPTAPATPTFSPAGGTFTAAQSVTLADTTSGATIYYTVNGTTPTASSTRYTAAISVTSTETIKAIAILNGTSSTVASATYTITSTVPPICTTINYSGGFASSKGLTLNRGASIKNNLLQLTDGGNYESRSAFYSTVVPVTGFTTDFTFQLLNAVSDGFTFTVQAKGATADGLSGEGLGYQNIPNSAAIKFDLHNNSGEGVDSTGIYFNGALPTTPAINLAPSGIDLHSGHVFAAHITYAGTTGTLTITDTVTKAVFTTSMTVPAIANGATAYVGFTGGTGAGASTQNILSWTYSGGTGCGTTK